MASWNFYCIYMTVSYNSQMNIQKHVTMRTYDMVNEIKYINNCSDRFLGTFYAINDKIVQNSIPLFAALVEWRWYSFFLSVVAFFFDINHLFLVYTYYNFLQDIHIHLVCRHGIYRWLTHLVGQCFPTNTALLCVPKIRPGSTIRRGCRLVVELPVD